MSNKQVRTISMDCDNATAKQNIDKLVGGQGTVNDMLNWLSSVLKADQKSVMFYDCENEELIANPTFFLNFAMAQAKRYYGNPKNANNLGYYVLKADKTDATQLIVEKASKKEFEATTSANRVEVDLNLIVKFNKDKSPLHAKLKKFIYKEFYRPFRKDVVINQLKNLKRQAKELSLNNDTKTVGTKRKNKNLQEYLDSVTAEVLKRQEKEFGIDENLNIDCQGQILEAVKMLQYASKGLYK
jgi:hypothetical protein